MKDPKHQSIEEKVKNWIKIHHGSAGWEQKLVALCQVIDTKAKIEEELYKEDCPPMGVSQWKEYGKKYGYWEYFDNKVDEVRVMLEIEHAKELMSVHEETKKDALENILDEAHGGGNWRRIVTQVLSPLHE